MRSHHCFEMKIHIYLNKQIDAELIEKVISLKSKRRLNKAILKLLREYEEEGNQIDLFKTEKPS